MSRFLGPTLTILTGKVVHIRKDPINRRFCHNTGYGGSPLLEGPGANVGLATLSTLPSSVLTPSDVLALTSAGPEERCSASARGCGCASVTIPLLLSHVGSPHVGVQFNPVVYYLLLAVPQSAISRPTSMPPTCVRAVPTGSLVVDWSTWQEWQLVGLLSQVTNTPWGEDKVYDCTDALDSGAQFFTKQLHVSPFHTMDYRYHFTTSLRRGPVGDSLGRGAPGSTSTTLRWRMLHADTDREAFVACLRVSPAQHHLQSTWARLCLLLWHLPAHSAIVIVFIYAHAAALVTKIPFIPHPKYATA